MNICLVTESYPTLPPYGGIAVYAHTAAHGLAARGHTVHVLVGRQGAPVSDCYDGPIHLHVRSLSGIPILERRFSGLGESVCLAWHLWRLHRRHQFDIVELSNWEGLGLVPVLLHVAPIIVRMHTPAIEYPHAQGRPPRTDERFVIWADKTAARASRLTLTHSLFNKANIETNYGVRNVRVIPHGIELPTEVSTSTESVLAVLYAGYLNSRKGTGVLLEAIPNVLGEVPEAEFWIAGKDPEHKFENTFRSTNPHIPASKVKFFGFVPDADRISLYQRCAIYASPSVYESFGLSIVEAMGYAKPVVVCNTSAMPEIVVHNTTGLLVPPKDPEAYAAAIVTLLRDAPLRRRMGEMGRARALEHYAAPRMAQEMESLFQELFARQEAHAP
jgi:glycosyltransferase involved in cell wall biosynthesis